MAVFTLDYWIDDGWYVGRLREVPEIFSQGKTLEDLKLNIRDALELMLEESAPPPVPDYDSVELQVEATRSATAGGPSTEKEARRSLTLAAAIDPETARARLDAVRSALAPHDDERAEELIRELRHQRTSSLDVR